MSLVSFIERWFGVGGTPVVGVIPGMARVYYVYILASRSRTLYVGVTNDLRRRLEEHRGGKSSFTRRYRIERLVYVETTAEIDCARRRERQLKSFSRRKKIQLITDMNPAWEDLSPS